MMRAIGGFTHLSWPRLAGFCCPRVVTSSLLQSCLPTSPDGLALSSAECTSLVAEGDTGVS